MFSLTLLLKQGQLEHVVHDHVQSGFEYLQEWRLPKLYKQSASVFDLPQSKFLMFK